MADVLFSYDFLVVALGSMFLAIVASIVGCFSVYKGQSLIGDAIGHASYPGVILAFILFMSREPVLLMLGAIVIGSLAYITIQSMVNHSKISFDSSLAIVLSGFFGLGMVLKTYIQGHKAYLHLNQAGLKSYIFGSTAFILKSDVYLILIVAIIVLLILYVFYKEILVSIFDRDYARSIGLKTGIVDFVLLIMMMSVIALGLKSVGAILISSFLIIPCICANQHTKKIKNVFVIAVLVSVVSSLVGVYFSTIVNGLSTGPMIILCMGILTFLSFIFGKYGILKQFYIKRGIEHE